MTFLTHLVERSCGYADWTINKVEKNRSGLKLDALSVLASKSIKESRKIQT